MNRIFLHTFAAVASAIVAIVASNVSAQTIANGPYYATPSWDQTLPVATRFIVLSNFGSAAVLDRETGVVWERSPSLTPVSRELARSQCLARTVGGRMGWRVPSVHEAMSLVDPAIATGPKLPPGHPFANVGADWYWTATAYAFNSPIPWEVNFLQGTAGVNNSLERPVWCVRGGGPISNY